MTDNVYEISNVFKIVEKKLKKYSSAEVRRMLHGRGGTFEKLDFINIDLFKPALLITLYDWRDSEWKKGLSDLLLRLESIETIVFQNRIKAPWTNDIFGVELPLNHVVSENHLLYSVSLAKGENPGIFPDMREGRSYVKSISRDRKILNLFSYTCGFSVAAIEGGAKSVLNMDMNSNSLSRGRVNHEINHHDKGPVSYLSHNILKSFGKISKNGPFDLIIIDPPPSQGSSFNLERDYGKILRRSGDFLGGSGEILACLNSHSYDFKWFASFLKNNAGVYEIIREFGAGEDFPEKNAELGLKIVHLKISG